MFYLCPKCSRSFTNEEQLSFCPFCGTAYFTSAAFQSTQRIVIGSDSERTIQEKYWRESQQMIRRGIRLLGNSIPRFSHPRPEPDDPADLIPKEYRTKELDVRGFFARCRSASTGSFGTILSSYLAELHDVLNTKFRILSNLHAAAADPRHAEIRELIDACDLTAFEDEYSVCIAKEESFICDICDQVAYLLGCHEPLTLHPVLKYAPESDDWSDMGDEEKAIPQLMDMKPYERLMTTLLKLQDTLIQIVQSNSVFILSNIRFDVNEIGNEDFDPGSFVPLIERLSAEDYDPVFGQSPEALLSVFSEAVARLSEFFNSLPDYLDWMAMCPEEDSQLLNRRLDMYKIRCLQQYLSDWQDALEREMDRAYQEQRADTIQVSERLKQIVDEL